MQLRLSDSRDAMLHKSASAAEWSSAPLPKALVQLNAFNLKGCIYALGLLVPEATSLCNMTCGTRCVDVLGCAFTYDTLFSRNACACVLCVALLARFVT